MCQEACLPSLTASTVVLQYPLRSPPQNTAASLLCIVSGLISGMPQDVNLIGAIALATGKERNITEVAYTKPTLLFMALKFHES